MSQFNFVQVNEFQPNVEGWSQIGEVSYQKLDDKNILLTNKEGYQIKISFLSTTAIRVRFNPVMNPDYSKNNSYAVVDRNLGKVAPVITELPDNGGTLHVNTGDLDIYIGLAPYGISVQKNGTVITEDTYSKNIVFSNEAVANLKKSPKSESYFGFGEKAGEVLDKKENTMTFFNYDNFTYNDIAANGSKVVPEDNEGGPLNPSGPLYNSMPYTLAIGKGEEKVEYAYGIYFDNVSQSYFNMGANDYSDMDGKYYFGALYGELDYYIMVGSPNDGSQNIIASVIQQYSKLTGASAMPPMYALGYQQGCYGYYDREILQNIAQKYRDNKIPIDGLHIDVDFQNNYRTFTNSEVKFPNVEQMFDELHEQGFKCSTNITGIITANPYDENGKQPGEEGYVDYPTRDNLVNLNTQNAMESTYKEGAVEAFIWDTRYESGESSNIFMANESYGENNGFNKYQKNYPSPGHPQGQNALGTYGYYSDMGLPNVQKYWGQQYDYLLRKGLDMIWQDMTCPAVVPNVDNGNPDKTLPFNLMMYDKVTEEYQPNTKIHNSFSLNLVEATYEGLTDLKTSKEYKKKNLYNYNKRNFIISRGGFAGVHRYAGIWTGDSASSWDFLKINIPEVLNIGLSGLPISGCDIGGFANGSGSVSENGTHGVTQYELFTRWMTAGAFLPWYRNHYDGYTKSFQEPFNYGDPVPANCRKYIEIRYQLLQLFYDSMFENTQTGMPIARAMFLNELDDINVFTYADQQFYVGKDLLVAPVTDQNWNKEVYLPKDNQWYVFDIEGGALPQATNGGQAYSWYVPLDLVPIYIREGAILPVRQLEQYVGELPENYLNFYIYPGKDSTYQLYLDDKTTMDAEQKKEYRVTKITSKNINSGKIVNFKRSYDNFTPTEAFFFVSFLGVTNPDVTIRIGKSKLKQVAIEDLNVSSGNAFAYDNANQKIIVKVFDTKKNISVEIDYLTQYKFNTTPTVGVLQM